jgi:hypothetical protein
LINNISTNGNILKYEKMIYQTAEPELNEPKLREIELIIKDLKNYKVLGKDEINPELLKLAEKEIAIEIYLLLKDIYRTKNVWLRIGI